MTVGTSSSPIPVTTSGPAYTQVETGINTEGDGSGEKNISKNI